MVQKALSLLFTVCSLFIISQSGSNICFAQRIPPEIQNILRNLPPDTLQNMMKENQPKGEMTFTALPPQQYFKPPPGVAATYQPYERFLQSGAAIAYEFDKCIIDGEETAYIKDVYVLNLDEEKMDSAFTTNQQARTASIKLKGQVERWSGKCNSGELRRAGKGAGGLELTFTNSLHLKPRFFQSNAVTGKMFGAGLNEVIQSSSKMGEPIAASYAKSENKSSYDPKLLAALRKAGFPIPDVDPEQLEKTAEEQMRSQGYELDLSKASFYGKAASPRQITIKRTKVPAVQIDFGISSGFEADMLVYRPLAMEDGGAANLVSAATSNVTRMPANGPFTYASYTPLPILEGIFKRSPQANVDNLLIPDGQQNSVGAQAYVNLDNDDNDNTFDIDDKSVRTGTAGDDDLVRVVIRLAKRPRPQRTGRVYFKVKEGKDYVQIWEDKYKEKRFVDRALDEIDSTTFVDGTGDLVNFRIKELWVEGIKQNDGANQQTKFEFTYYDSPMGTVSETETFAMTVIGIKSIEWEGADNSRDSNDNLDADPNHRNPADQFTNSDPRRAGRTFPAECGGKVESSLKDPAGVRVFPGRRVINGNVEPRPRNMVRARITLSTTPVEPISFHFKSFDVDDPTASDLTTTDPSMPLVDDETKDDDNRGVVEANNSHTGRFARESPDKIASLAFTGPEAALAFEVTMQPGDNFRIVGSGDADFFKNLENDDIRLNQGSSEADRNANKQRIVDKSVFASNLRDPSAAEIRQPSGYASKVLTVWRFLYGEVDYMSAIGENKLRGNVAKIWPGTPRAGQTKVDLDIDLNTEYKKISTYVSTFEGNNGLKDAFQEGKLRIGGSEYKILHSSAFPGRKDEVIVAGDVPLTFEGSTYFIWDDDADVWGFKKGMKLRDVQLPSHDRSYPGRTSIDENDGCYVAERYLPAYIVPDFKALKLSNRVTEVDFIRNIEGVQVGKGDAYLTKRHYAFDNVAYDNTGDVWVVYLLFGYRGATYEDGDPDGGSSGDVIPNTANENAIEGIADADKSGIIFFLEGIVERNDGYIIYNGRTGEDDCIAHEIGHLFGSDHPDKGLMGGGAPGEEQDSPVFSGTTLMRIRSAKHP